MNEGWYALTDGQYFPRTLSQKNGGPRRTDNDSLCRENVRLYAKL